MVWEQASETAESKRLTGETKAKNLATSQCALNLVSRLPPNFRELFRYCQERMMPRHMIHWRIHVYANSLYSLPDLKMRGFRDWTPQSVSRNPFEIHRVMNWVNRDVSVLMRTCKATVLNVFETILGMLPRVSINSLEFRTELTFYLGPKTDHFIHELINFARSPYDDLIAYDCNVQYRYSESDPDVPSTSQAARNRQLLGAELQNFVEFSRRINPDESGGFEVDLRLEDEDSGELDDLVMERYHRPVATVMRRAMERDMLAQPPGHQQQQQPEQPQTNPPPAHQTQPAGSSSGMVSLDDLELEVAIERSILDAGGAGEGGQVVQLPGGRTVFIANAPRARNLSASTTMAAGTAATEGSARTGLEVAGAGAGRGFGTVSRAGAGRGSVIVAGAGAGRGSGTVAGAGAGRGSGTVGGAGAGRGASMVVQSILSAATADPHHRRRRQFASRGRAFPTPR